MAGGARAKSFQDIPAPPYVKGIFFIRIMEGGGGQIPAKKILNFWGLKLSQFLAVTQYSFTWFDDNNNQRGHSLERLYTFLCRIYDLCMYARFVRLFSLARYDIPFWSLRAQQNLVLCAKQPKSTGIQNTSVHKKTLASRGLEELFSSCAVVSVFCSGGKQVLGFHTTYVLRVLYHTVVVLCQFFWFWREIVFGVTYYSVPQLFIIFCRNSGLRAVLIFR